MGIYLTNLYFTNLCLTNLKANPKSSIRTQRFQYLSYFEIQAAFLFWELKSLMIVGVAKSPEFKFDIQEQVRQ